jgi:hypothetical protein
MAGSGMGAASIMSATTPAPVADAIHVTAPMANGPAVQRAQVAAFKAVH